MYHSTAVSANNAYNIDDIKFYLLFREWHSQITHCENTDRSPQIVSSYVFFNWWKILLFKQLYDLDAKLMKIVLTCFTETFSVSCQMFSFRECVTHKINMATSCLRSNSWNMQNVNHTAEKKAEHSLAEGMVVIITIIIIIIIIIKAVAHHQTGTDSSIYSWNE